MSREKANRVEEIKKAISEKRENDLGNKWPANRSDAFEYFERHAHTFEVVTKELSKLNPETESVIYLDIAGRASFPYDPNVPIFREQYSYSLSPVI